MNINLEIQVNSAKESSIEWNMCPSLLLDNIQIKKITDYGFLMSL